jgi:hypothetical protein
MTEKQLYLNRINDDAFVQETKKLIQPEFHEAFNRYVEDAREGEDDTIFHEDTPFSRAEDFHTWLDNGGDADVSL